MALLTYAYNPTASVAVLVNALEAGQRRQQAEQSMIAGLAKSIADDRRHSEEFDRIQAFNAAKEAEDTRQFNVRNDENNRRYREENAPFSAQLPDVAPVTALTVQSEGLAPESASIPAAAKPTESLDLNAAGGPLPPSRSLLSGDPLDTSKGSMGFAELLATKRADQLKQGLEGVRSLGPDPGVMQDIEGSIAALQNRAQGANAAGMYAPPDLNGGDFSLAQVTPQDPFKPAVAANPAPAQGVNDGNIAGPLPAGKEAPGWEAPGSLMPSQQVAKFLGGLSSLNQPGQPPVIRNKDVRAVLPSIIRSTIKGATAAANGKPTPMSMQQAIDQYGLTPNPQSNTYSSRDGTEYFVGQGVGGGVSLTPKKPKEEKDRIISTGGNVWVVPPNGGEPRKIISKEVADTLPKGFPMKYANAVAAEESGQANLAESTRVWEARKAEKNADPNEVLRLEKEVQKRQAALRTAQSEVQTLHKQFPALSGGAESPTVGAPVAPAEGAAPAADTFETKEQVRDAVKAGTLSREKALEILESKFALK